MELRSENEKRKAELELHASENKKLKAELAQAKEEVVLTLTPGIATTEDSSELEAYPGESKADAGAALSPRSVESITEKLKEVLV